jgi:hypothetical protein
MNKFKLSFFHDFINNYDIIWLVETKLDDFDIVCCNGFKYIGLIRKSFKWNWVVSEKMLPSICICFEF